MLEAKVADGGLAARTDVEKIARDADDLEITFPSYAALTTWGAEGLDLIVNVASDGHTVKCKSAALSLLCLLAVKGHFPVSERFFWLQSTLVQLANQKLARAPIQADARQALRKLVLSTPVDDLLIPLSQSYIQLAMLSPELGEELAASLGVKWLRFGPAALDEYEKLIADEPSNETAFQSFFCRFPQFLDPMAVQIWSEPDFHGALSPDFVVKRADNSYLVVEIECPSKLLVTKDGKLAAMAIHAEKQVVEYESFLSERVAEARTHFPNYSRADCLAIVGLERQMTPSQRRNFEWAIGRRQNVRIVGFDWLLDRARTLIDNVTEGGAIEVIQGKRII